MNYQSTQLWSSSEIRRLNEMADNGSTLKEAMKALPGRSDWAIILKLRSLILNQNYDDLKWLNFYSNPQDMAYPIKELRANHGDEWSTLEKEKLASYFEGDTELGQISKLLGKTDFAVFIQLKKIYKTTDGLEPVFKHFCSRKRLVKLQDALQNVVIKQEISSIDLAFIPDVCRPMAQETAFVLSRIKGKGNDLFIIQTVWPQCVFQLVPFESKAAFSKYEKKSDPKFKLFNQKQVHDDYWKIGLLFMDCLLRADGIPEELMKKVTNNAAYDAAEWYISYCKTKIE